MHTAVCLHAFPWPCGLTLCVGTDIHQYEWVYEPGLGESCCGDDDHMGRACRVRAIRLDLQYCYFLNLHCFVGGTNPGCLGCCIMECFIHLPNKSWFHVENESEQGGASACCGDPHRRVAWGWAVEAKEDRPTESCHNGELRGLGEGFCAVSQSHFQCPSAQCPKTEGLASQEANTTDGNFQIIVMFAFYFETGLLWFRLVWSPDPWVSGSSAPTSRVLGYS